MQHEEAYIYVIVCNPTCKFYVGSSTNTKKRFKDHRRLLRHSRHYNAHLQNAWNKYGETSFSLEILETCSIPERLIREQYWIDKLAAATKDGLNVAKSVTYVPPKQYKAGQKHSDKTKKLLSDRQASKFVPEETVVAILQQAYEGVRTVDLCKFHNRSSSLIEKVLRAKSMYVKELIYKHGLESCVVPVNEKLALKKRNNRAKKEHDALPEVVHPVEVPAVNQGPSFR